MRGRKPTPTHLKLFRGNPGRRPINEHEPKPDKDLLVAPDWLTERQRAAWTYAIANVPAGLLKRIDRNLLAVWVVAEDLHARAVQAQARLDALPGAAPLLVNTVSGPQPSPYLGVVNKQALILLKAASELGFTPASRSRIRVEEEGSERNPFDEI